jgi:SAM-dependent methyltransferase
MPGWDPATAIARRGEVAVLDVRDEAAFRAGHWSGSGNIPLAELKPRRSELPPRDSRVLVLADDVIHAKAAAVELEELGYDEVAWLDAALELLQGGRADVGPPARLWRPAPFLESVLPRLKRGRVLDLAAGAGRESVFLAMHGFEVEAWDHDRDVLEKARALASRHGASIQTAVHNLEWRGITIPEGRYDVITVFRFLQRALFPHIERALAPGGHLVYETYRRGQARFGRPKHPRFLLDDGELARAFPTLVVEHYEELDPEGGPITARLLARRPEEAR